MKLARLGPEDGGEVLNAQPEFEDVAAAARALGVPVKSLMADAVAAAQRLARKRS